MCFFFSLFLAALGGRRTGGSPRGGLRRGVLCLCRCLCLGRCSAVCAVFASAFRPRWRCVFAVWLRLPGEPARSCAGGWCPLSPAVSGCCSGGPASLVPGSAGALRSASVFAFPAAVAARRSVARRWLLACGWPGPGSGWFLSPAFALPFPSVLSAGWRAGLLSSLWLRCRRARAARSAAWSAR